MKNKMEKKNLNQVQGPIPEVIAVCTEVFEERNERRILAAWIYGSVLGSRHRRDSDLDIAVLDSLDHPLSWSAQSSLMDALERVSGWPVDLRMVREECYSFQLYVLTQGRQLWIRDVGAVKRYVNSLRSMYEEERRGCVGLWRETLRHLACRAGR